MSAPPPDAARVERLRAQAAEYVATRRLPHIARVLDMLPAHLERFLAERPDPPAPTGVLRRVRSALASLVAGLPAERRAEGAATMERTLRALYADRPEGAPGWAEVLREGDDEPR